jgi:hypothetical protein
MPPARKTPAKKPTVASITRDIKKLGKKRFDSDSDSSCSDCESSSESDDSESDSDSDSD